MVGMSDGQVFFKYNRSVDIENDGKFLVFDSNPDAYWFDDYEEAQTIIPKGVFNENLGFLS